MQGQTNEGLYLYTQLRWAAFNTCQSCELYALLRVTKLFKRGCPVVLLLNKIQQESPGSPMVVSQDHGCLAAERRDRQDRAAR